jgi:hypothetical protein
MATQNRKQTVKVTLAANTDWVVVEVPRLLNSGILSLITYRLDNTPGAVNGTVDNIRVLDGAYSASTSSAEVAAAPIDDIVYSESAVALTASSTTGVQTNILSSVGETAIYDKLGGSSEDAAGVEKETVLALQGDGTIVGDVYVTIRAKDVNGAPGR